MTIFKKRYFNIVHDGIEHLNLIDFLLDEDII